MIVVDCETTGLEPHANGLVSIGAVLFEDQAKKFYVEMKPAEGTILSPQSLEINGYTPEYLEKIPLTTYGALQKYGTWVEEVEPAREKHFLGGFNTHFDGNFIRFAYARVPHLLEPRFDFRYVDAYSVFIAKYGTKYLGYSLRMVCEALGVEPEPYPHNALNGAIKTAEVLKIMLEDGKSANL